jgi:hypothetical protein
LSWRHATIDWSFACSATTELAVLERLVGVVFTDAMVAAANLVEIAALVGDTARATVLNALMGGQSLRARPAISESVWAIFVSRDSVASGVYIIFLND